MRVVAKINQDCFNLVNDEVKEEDITTLCAQKTDKLKTINLSRTGISPPLLLQLWKANWKSLQGLYLHGNKLAQKGCKYLTKAIVPTLTILDLRFNHIGSAGLLHLSKGVWKKLKDLNLQVNVIGEGGTHWMIRGNWVISDLSLKWNKISGVQVQNLLISRTGEMLSLKLANNLIKKDEHNSLKKKFTEKSKINNTSQLKFEISF